MEPCVELVRELCPFGLCVCLSECVCVRVSVCVRVCVSAFRFLPSIERRLALKVVEVIPDSSQSCRSLPLCDENQNIK